MTVGIFIFGCIVFGLYVFGYLYMIWWANDSQRRAMRRDDIRDGIVSDEMDMDGMGNFSRFPVDKEREALKKKRNSRKTKTKTKKPV